MSKPKIILDVDVLKGEVDRLNENVEDVVEELDRHKADYAIFKNDTETALPTKATTATYTATLNTTWTGTAAPFTKAQTVTGILATDNPIIDVEMSGTYATDEARAKAWGHIYRAVTTANTVTFYAKEKPTVELPIQLKVVR